MSRICEGRTVIVTGAGRGIGRAHALELARQGARVVVNDLGVALDGRAAGEDPARAVAEEIRALGGEAVANHDDIADTAGAARLIQSALEAFGRLDVLVNNAGFVRDRMLVNLDADDFDAVIRVHLRGHFLPSKHAAAHFRERAKAGGAEAVNGRIINTSSGAGLLGSVGQAAYSAAKAGIAALTLVAAAELARYGVTVNALAPAARTRMTETVFADMMKKPADGGGFDAMDPANVSPLVAWLASTESGAVSGRVFEVSGGKLGVAEGWHAGPAADKGARWEPGELGPVVAELLGRAMPAQKPYGA